MFKMLKVIAFFTTAMYKLFIKLGEIDDEQLCLCLHVDVRRPCLTVQEKKCYYMHCYPIFG
jgi:hypothetical protein